MIHHNINAFVSRILDRRVPSLLEQFGGRFPATALEYLVLPCEVSPEFYDFVVENSQDESIIVTYESLDTLVYPLEGHIVIRVLLQPSLENFL